jgi:uncharacterized protein
MNTNFHGADPRGSGRSGPVFLRLPSWLISGLLGLMVLTGCGGAADQPAATVKTVDDRFSIKVGERTVQMQIAARPEELQKGLMFRTAMGPDEGMLFVFTQPQPQGFWMRNTILPLDIGYFEATGELKEIYPMYPHDEKTVSSRSHAIQFCLEMNQGWYRQNNVKPGAQLDLAAVAAALQARGLKPAAFGLR